MSARRSGGRGRGRGRQKKAAGVEEVGEDQNGVLKDDCPELEASPPPVVAERSPSVRKSVRLNPAETPIKSDGEDVDIEINRILDEFTPTEESQEDTTNGDDGKENDSKANTGEEEAMETGVAETEMKAEVSEVSANDDNTESADPETASKQEGKTKCEEEDLKLSTMTVVDEVNEENGEGNEEPEDEEEASTQVEDTEMVSEDELPSENKEPLDTEAVSDEELPESSSRQAEDLPETESVSEDELPPVADKKKKKKIQPSETEAVSEDELPDEKKEEKADNVTTDAEGEEGRKSDSQKRKLPPEGEYDPSSPTSETSQDDLPAAKKQALADGKAATPKPPVKKVLPELDKYWKAVVDDATDFTGWTYLLQYVDQENDIDAARDAYDAFLSHYPYCYGYWRKYADYEKKKGNSEKCEELPQIQLACR